MVALIVRIDKQSQMNQTNPKPYVFVLMPFDDAFDDIYKFGIKAACEEAGAYCERVDEQIFVENILDRVYNQIAKADIIVAEMTGRNPNVFYETGYAHALNKRVILLTQNTEDIPFDLKHYPHIIYEGKIARLRTELETRVRWCIDNPLKSLPSFNDELAFYIQGVQLSKEHLTRLPMRIALDSTQSGFEFSVAIDIQNRGRKSIMAESVELVLVLPAYVTGYSPLSQPNQTVYENENHINLGTIKRLLPQTFQNVWLGCSARPAQIVTSFQGTLKVYSEFHVMDFPLEFDFEFHPASS